MCREELQDLKKKKEKTAALRVNPPRFLQGIVAKRAGVRVIITDWYIPISKQEEKRGKSFTETFTVVICST